MRGDSSLILELMVDLAEIIELALVDREGDVEILAVGRQFGDRRDDAEIGIALLQIESAQLFAVEGQPVRVVIVVRGEEFPPRALSVAISSRSVSSSNTACCR